MVAESKCRVLYILKYLWENTDEEHPASTNDILEFLAASGLATTRKTVTDDVAELQSCGIDVVCNRSRKNEYFVGTRHLELAELKLLVDAVQAAKFISPKKSMELIGKLSALTSPNQGDLLKRNLFVDGKAKTENEAVFYSVDTLYTAIRLKCSVTFKYIEYTAKKKKVDKHNGQVYIFSPYDMVWCNDAYYVFGWSESHGKTVKFRVDRMKRPEMSDKPFHPKPDDYDIASFCRSVFSMYDGQLFTVELKCENSMMKNVIDRFGEDVPTRLYDCTHFVATAQVSVSPTFFSWVFTYADKLEILSPSSVRDKYAERLQMALNQGK